jgi:hypothetical protein
MSSSSNWLRVLVHEGQKPFEKRLEYSNARATFARRVCCIGAQPLSSSPAAGTSAPGAQRVLQDIAFAALECLQAGVLACRR